MLALTASVLLVAAGPAKATTVEPVTLEGKVREVSAGPGGRPRALLVTRDKRYVLHALDPGFRKELRRLSGVVVKVEGVLGDPRVAGQDHVLVDRYEIVDVGKGVVPRVGHIAQREVEGQARLVFVDRDGKADLLPVSWVRKMHRHVGAKLWIVGHHDESGKFRPQRFAILRSAPPADDEKPKP